MRVHAVGSLTLAQLAGDIAGVKPYVVPPSRAAQLAALEAPEGPVLTIGDDSWADLVPIGVARFRYGEDLALHWFDTPANEEVLRTLLGEGESAADPPVRHVVRDGRDVGACAYVHVNLEVPADIGRISVPVVGAGITGQPTTDPTPFLEAVIAAMTRV